jgi:membrane AbrB-like protein
MTATLILALSGVHLAYPRWLQNTVLGMIGISVGGSLSMDLFSHALLWLPSVAGQVTTQLAALLVGTLTMRYLARQTTETSFLASYPGHLVMVLGASTSGQADSRIVAIAQSLRLVTLVALVPLLIHAQGVVPASAPIPPLEPLSALAVIVAGLIGIALAIRLRFPSPPLMGGILGAGIASIYGFSLGPIPDKGGAVLLLIVGTMIGARFSGMSRMALLTSIPRCVLTVSTVLAVVGLLSWPISRALGLPFAQVALAYSPGGADVMPLLALAQGYDAVYVGVHHGVRLLVMALLLPFAMRILDRKA